MKHRSSHRELFHNSPFPFIPLNFLKPELNLKSTFKCLHYIKRSKQKSKASSLSLKIVKDNEHGSTTYVLIVHYTGFIIKVYIYGKAANFVLISNCYLA